MVGTIDIVEIDLVKLKMIDENKNRESRDCRSAVQPDNYP